MRDPDEWARRFEAHRGHLRGVAYRMLGSASEADDAVQEAWLRLTRVDPAGLDNLGGWLTRVVGRICLDLLRARAHRGEEPWDQAHEQAHEHVPGPVLGQVPDPQDEAIRADSVGLALLVVLDRLGPAERVAFVLHDMFSVPFDQIGPIVGRSANAAKMMASRARQRVRDDAGAEPDPPRQRRAIDAFLAASRDGDFQALLAVLDPDVVVRADVGGAPELLRGARVVAGQALAYSDRAAHARVALVDGAVGIAVEPGGRLSMVMIFTVRGARITAIDIVSAPGRLSRLRIDR